MLHNLGPSEIILILVVVVLLFGAKKLPDLARGSGRALRIFKSETKGLMDDDDKPDDTDDRSDRDQSKAPRELPHSVATNPADESTEDSRRRRGDETP